MKTEYAVKVTVKDSIGSAMKSHPELSTAGLTKLVVLQAPTVAPSAQIDTGKLGVQSKAPRVSRGPKA